MTAIDHVSGNTTLHTTYIGNFLQQIPSFTIHFMYPTFEGGKINLETYVACNCFTILSNRSNKVCTYLLRNLVCVTNMARELGKYLSKYLPTYLLT